LYKIIIATLQKVSQNSPTLLMTKHQPKISLWHEQLGHISIQGLHELSKEGYATRLPYILVTSIVCDDCVLGKQHKEIVPTKSVMRAI
jgi:hypothetical protein